MAKDIPKNITREMLLEEANRAKSEIDEALSRAYANRDFLAFGQKKVTPEMKEIDKRIKLLLEQDKIVDKIIKDNTEKMRQGGTTGNKNWFQKAIAETGSLNLGGWKKTMPRAERRLHAYASHKNASNTVHDASLSTARALQALANVTQDKDTKKKAKSDADYFFKQAKDSKKKKVGMKSRGGMYNEGGSIPEHKYVYSVIEERGHLQATIESIPHGEFIWEYDSEKEEGSPVEYGFMRNWHDIKGLEKYLKDLKTIPQNAEILSPADAQKRYDYYEKGGSLYNAGGGLGTGDILLKDEGDYYIIYDQTGKGLAWMVQHGYTYGKALSVEEGNKIINNQNEEGIEVEQFSKGGIVASAFNRIKKWLGEKI